METCEVADCTNTKIQARGMCSKHYARWNRTGSTGTVIWSKDATLKERFEGRLLDLVPETGCLNWTGATSQGYGELMFQRKPLRAHRVAYELYVGAIPDGKHVLHSCDNKLCVNPAHLSAGDHAENMRQHAERRRDEYTPSTATDRAIGYLYNEARLTLDEIAGIMGITTRAVQTARDRNYTCNVVRKAIK